MNKRDRSHLARLYSAVQRWPWPRRDRTVGVAEMAEFFGLMGRLQPLFARAIMAISVGPDEESGLESPEEALDALEDALNAMRGGP